MATLAAQNIDWWQERLRRDLQPFIDPGTELSLESTARTIKVDWFQRSVQRSISVSGFFEGTVVVEANGRQETYAGFFAGPSMGDLAGLAKMMLQAQPKDKLYIRTRARALDAPDGKPSYEDAITLIRREIDGAGEDDNTLLLVITGEPGAGKTCVLQEVVRSTASAYLGGGSKHLYLYINAQGRALARFNEALATELQDLRSQLTYHTISTLVRLGLVVPIVDGFDELLGAGGYDDAFSSLSAFLEELDGMGAMVASARSTYYEHEFVLRANRTSSLGSQAWTQRPIEIAAWSDSEFENYVTEVCGGLPIEEATAKRAEIRGLFDGHEDLKRKPFFVARVVELVLEGKSFSKQGSLLERLVSAYLLREQTEKLLDRAGKALLSMEQLEQLYSELAEEMWNQETRQLDARSVRELAEWVLLANDEGGPGSPIVVQRMPTMAFLGTGSRPGSVTFEHESFFNYFLAIRLREKLASAQPGLERFLGRSVLPNEVAEHAVIGLDLNSNQAIQKALDQIQAAAMKPSLNGPTARESGGVIVLELLNGSREGVVVRHVDFPGGDLRRAQLVNVTFEDVEFRRTDLSRSSFVLCRAQGTTLVEVTVDTGTTKLDFSGTVDLSAFRGLRVHSNQGTKVTYEPTEMASALAAIGAIHPLDTPAVRKVDEEVLRVLDVLARGYLRSNPITVEDFKLNALKRSSIWPGIEDALVRHGIVSPETRETRGTKKVFLRRKIDLWTVIEGFSQGSQLPEVAEFCKEIEAAFPVKL